MTERITQLEAELATLKNAPPPTPDPVVFKPGDLVRLRALNGPIMVVCALPKMLTDKKGEEIDTGNAVCGWFDKNHVYATAEMPTAALQMANV